MGLTGIDRYYAWFFDDSGEDFGQKNFSKKDSSFSYEKKKYIIDLKASFKKKKGFLFDKKYFFYNVNNPQPKIFTKKENPILDAETFEIMMETNVAKKLNDLAKGSLSDLLTPKNMLIAGGILVFGYIVLSSGGLF